MCGGETLPPPEAEGWRILSACFHVSRHQATRPSLLTVCPSSVTPVPVLSRFLKYSRSPLSPPPHSFGHAFVVVIYQLMPFSLIQNTIIINIGE